MRHPKLPTRTTPGVAAFLSLVDRIEVRPDIPTSATALTDKGELLLLLGDMYMNGSDFDRREMLKHEATHFYLNHLVRFPGEKTQQDMMLWNLVIDAAQHYLGGCHCDSPMAVTWEKLELSPMSPELAFELLKENMPESPPTSCGSMEHSSASDSLAAKIKRMEAAGVMGREKEFAEMTKCITGGRGHRDGAYLELLPPPTWIRETFEHLLSKVADERRRSWRRENRQSRLLPGRSYSYGVGALFLIDSSASIDSSTLQMFMSAVQSTPELAGSSCVIFDDEASARVPASAVQSTLASWGRGGTSFGPPAAMRQAGEAVVWLTDGYPCDSFPEPHTDAELWCITGDVVPPHGVRIQVE